uniref:Uncharacterized protein n=1 Tax=Picea sitchensis TaxID=3332 RepID=D5AE04_PICSI|nr:unknown [Picea sitchensis]
MIERRRPEKLNRMMNLAAVVSVLVVMILIILSSLICFASAARQSAFFHAEMKDKDHKAASGLFKPSGKDCHSGKSLSHCSPISKQMGNSNMTGADKRVVPTGPNPLHNR